MGLLAECFAVIVNMLLDTSELLWQLMIYISRPPVMAQLPSGYVKIAIENDHL